MATKPPSRRKPGESTEQPTTIDLTAEKTVTSDPTSDQASSAPVTPEAAATVEPVSVDPLSNQAGPTDSPLAYGDEAPASSTSDSSAASTPGTFATETPRDAAADAAAAFSEEPASSRPESTRSEPAYTAPTPQKSGTSTSGALAAGILGGLIVLAAAGSLQYAGILPSLSPRETSSESIAALQAEIDTLKNAPAAASADLAPVEQRLATLEQKTGEGQGVDLGPLTQQLTDLSTAVASLQAASGTAESTLGDLNTRIEAIEKKLAEPTAETRLARAVAVTALKTAIDRGGPYLAELDAFKSVAPEDPAIAPLTEDAQAGVATRADLIDAFPAVADAMLDAVRQRDPNQGVFGRLLDSAASAVRIRPVGDVEGSGPDAAIARIERALTNGDLKAAALEWDTLPDAAKTAGADFRRKLDRRIAVETAISSAVAAPVTTPNQG